MRRQIVILCSLSALSIFLFCGIFSLLQDAKVYRNTLGLVSQNYERSGGWNEYTISKVSKPFLEINNEHFLQWDASIYYCIKENSYVQEDACYGKVRAAFFPLFPFLWKITKASPLVISILNYLIFISALMLLVMYVLPGDIYLRATTFILLITFPTNVIYMIPYSESLFMLCMAIAAIGILKKNYALYFIGALLLAMVRPATLFVWLAILAAELFFFLKNRDLKDLVKHVFSKSVPFLLGYFIVIFIQYVSSGSWTAMVDAQKFWSGGLKGIERISDWSVEGFGMNTFSIIFVAVPATFALLYLGLRLIPWKKSTIALFARTNRNLLLLIGLFYMAGILCFSLLTAGGNFHSLFRFIICSPLFFIVILILIAQISTIDPKLLAAGFMAALLLLFFYLAMVDYGGDRLQFPFGGLFMLTITSAYALFRRFFPRKLDTIVLSLIVVSNTVWNTYMLNVFFSNGWIFT
ncbi:MAG: hypothetical protein WBG42_01615 [Cryomorphaceae bacterium]